MAFKEFTIDRIETVEGSEGPPLTLVYIDIGIDVPGMNAHQTLKIKTVHPLDRSKSMQAIEAEAFQQAAELLSSTGKFLVDNGPDKVKEITGETLHQTNFI